MKGLSRILVSKEAGAALTPTLFLREREFLAEVDAP